MAKPSNCRFLTLAPKVHLGKRRGVIVAHRRIKLVYVRSHPKTHAQLNVRSSPAPAMLVLGGKFGGPTGVKAMSPARTSKSLTVSMRAEDERAGAEADSGVDTGGAKAALIDARVSMLD